MALGSRCKLAVPLETDVFGLFPQSEFLIVAKDGQIRGKTQGIYSADSITIADVQVIIEPGDELRRTIANGTQETFEVIEPIYRDAFHAIPAHFDVKIRRKGSFAPGKGGNFTVNMSGPNSRLNINSTDNSVNTNIRGSLFGDIKSAIEGGVADHFARQCMLEHLSEMERAKEDKSALVKAYQSFIASAAEHMTVITPFLPALGQLFG